MSAYRILCVDDNNDSAELINLMLKTSGENYSVTTVRTAEHALDAIKKQAFDMFILDYKIPEMSGVEICRNLRQKGLSTPIMFFTAMAYPDDRKTAIEAGANEYLVKPIDFEKLPRTVKKLLTSNQEHRKSLTRAESNEFSGAL